MQKIEIGNVLSQAWELTKKCWLTVLVGFLGIWIIQHVVTSLFGAGNAINSLALSNELQEHLEDPEYLYSILIDIYKNAFAANMISGLIGMILMVGFVQTLLNCVRGKSDFAFDAWKLPTMTYVKVVFTTIIISIIEAVGFCFCILPGIYLKARLQYADFYLLDHKEASITEAISASWNMTTNDALTLSLLLIVYVLIGIVGFCCCCIGLIPAYIIIYLSVAVCYATLAPAPEAPAEEQPTAAE